MNRKLLLTFLVLAAGTVLAAGCGPPPEYAEQAVWAFTVPERISQPELMTWWPGHRVAGTAIGLAVPASAKQVEKVTIYVPAGDALNPTAYPGAHEGHVFLGTDKELDDGPLRAVTPQQWENTPQAQACAPGQHEAVWVARLPGYTTAIPFFVDPTSGPATTLGAYELQACLPLANISSPGGPPLGSSMRFLIVSLTGVTAPSAPQLNVWRAYVSNPDSTGLPDPTTTYELRVDQPLPASLGLTGKLDRKHRHARLSGRLTASGISVAGVPVTLYRLSPDGLVPLAKTQTRSDGTYSFSRRIKSTTTYEAEAGGSSGSCQDASSAPAGCLDETLEYVDSPHVLVVLHHRHR
jgi:hypothetical protein